MYEVFDHTADIGIRVQAARVDELFAEAARALFSLIVANFDSVQALQEISVHLAAERLDELLFDWLAELLYTSDVRRMVFAQFTPSVQGNQLNATAKGEPIDPARHRLDREIKAITYHGLKLEHDGQQWLAQVILDV